MSIYDHAAVLLVIVAALGWFNRRLVRLPTTISLVIVGLAASLVVIAVDRAVPGWHLRQAIASHVDDIDFNRLLMYGMLSFLLFAGALHTNLDDLLRRRWTILLLATVGVLISTFLVGTLAWLLLPLVGAGLPWTTCLVFGALISPTDPIAVLGILKTAGVPPRLASIVAGESLFNDGIGVVAFIVITSLAGLGAGHGTHAPGALDVVLITLQEVGGGILLGLGLGAVAFLALRAIDDHVIEVQITLALVMIVTVIGGRLHLSGPIAVVLAGLLLGNHGRRFAMSDNTRDHLEKFWELVDEILNAVLFLLIGLEVFAVSLEVSSLLAGLVLIPVVLLSRGVSVGLPVLVMSRLRPFDRGTIPVLVWSGLRGGISVALVLSLPPFPGKEVLVTGAYLVVLFSILGQGLTVGPLVSRVLAKSGAP